MIFSIGDHVNQIISGTKTQTRRRVKPGKPSRYLVDKTYAVQRKRGHLSIPDGRIKITYVGVEHRGEQIHPEDAIAEGYYSVHEYEELYERMYPGWKFRWVYHFRFIQSSRGKVKSTFLNFLEWEERSAEEIRNDPTHERHSEHWNERYWHGFAAAMRHVQKRFKDEFIVVRENSENDLGDL